MFDAEEFVTVKSLEFPSCNKTINKLNAFRRVPSKKSLSVCHLTAFIRFFLPPESRLSVIIYKIATQMRDEKKIIRFEHRMLFKTDYFQYVSTNFLR